MTRELLNEQEIAMMKDQGQTDADIAAENERRENENQGTPVPGADVEPPAETAEEKLTRLEAELTEAKAADAGKVKDIVSMRDETRLLKAELEGIKAGTPPSGQAPVSLFPEVADDEEITGAELKKVREAFNVTLQAERDFNTNTLLSVHRSMSEEISRLRHPDDFDDNYGRFQEKVKTDPLLQRIANLEPNPVEFMYKWGVEHAPEVDPAKAKAAGAAEVVDKLNKAKPNFPSGGAGGKGPTQVTMEQASKMSPSEWQALPEPERARILKESGG